MSPLTVAILNRTYIFSLRSIMILCMKGKRMSVLTDKDTELNKMAELKAELFRARVRFDNLHESNYRHYLNTVRQKKYQQGFRNWVFEKSEELEKEIEHFFYWVKKHPEKFDDTQQELTHLNRRSHLLQRAVSKTDMFIADMFSCLFEDTDRENEALQQRLTVFKQLNKENHD